MEIRRARFAVVLSSILALLPIGSASAGQDQERLAEFANSVQKARDYTGTVGTVVKVGSKLGTTIDAVAIGSRLASVRVVGATAARVARPLLVPLEVVTRRVATTAAAQAASKVAGRLVPGVNLAIAALDVAYASAILADPNSTLGEKIAFSTAAALSITAAANIPGFSQTAGLLSAGASLVGGIFQTFRPPPPPPRPAPPVPPPTLTSGSNVGRDASTGTTAIAAANRTPQSLGSGGGGPAVGVRR